MLDEQQESQLMRVAELEGKLIQEMEKNQMLRCKPISEWDLTLCIAALLHCTTGIGDG